MFWLGVLGAAMSPAFEHGTYTKGFSGSGVFKFTTGCVLAGSKAKISGELPAGFEHTWILSPHCSVAI